MRGFFLFLGRQSQPEVNSRVNTIDSACFNENTLDIAFVDTLEILICV